MIEAIKEIGEYEIKKRNIKDVDLFIDDTLNASKVLCIDFEWDEKKIIYKGVHSEDFDKEKLKKYLYRPGTSRGTDITPTAKAVSKENKKDKNTVSGTFETTKIYPWFKKYRGDNTLILSIQKVINEEGVRMDIRKKLDEEYLTLIKQLDKNERKKPIIITLQFNKEKYIGDYEVFEDILVEEAKKRFYSRDTLGESKSENKMCFFCGNITSPIYGFASPFSFSTVDKRGFAPNFIQQDSWKQFPVCYECALCLDVGKRFLEKYLPGSEFDFFQSGFKYYLIPAFVASTVRDNEKIIKVIKEWGSNMPFSKDYVNAIMQDEADILELLSKQGDIMSLTFLFYSLKGGGKYQNIELIVEEVLPSWLNKMFETKRYVEKKYVFREKGLRKIFGINERPQKKLQKFLDKERLQEGVKFNFGIVRLFFPSSKSTGIYNKYFLDVIRAILSNKEISNDILMNAFMRELRNEYLKDKKDIGLRMKILAIKSLLFLSFKNNLKQNIEMEKNVSSEDMEKLTSMEKINKFFEEFKENYDCPAKKGVFLTGVLTGFLLGRQGSVLGSTPFREKLYGLELDEKRVKKLLPKISEKLYEYKKLGRHETDYSWLQEIVGDYLNKAGENWGLSRDTISYYFTLGLILWRIFK